MTATGYLDVLLADVDRVVAEVRRAPRPAREALAVARRAAAVAASLRLDGAAPPAADAAATATWLDTLRAGTLASPAGGPPHGRTDGPPATSSVTIDAQSSDAEVAALEAAGVAAGMDAVDLGPELLTAPVATLRTLHRRIVAGLVSPERAGADRRTEQAVHDGSTGRILFRTPPPHQVPEHLARLEQQLADLAGADAHPVIVAGVLHLEVLALHPFDAANGRTARAAAGLVLRAGGCDPDGSACPDIVLAADPLGYHEEVAQTRHRQDTGIWLERWAEAVVTGLRQAARSLGVLGSDVDDAVRRQLLDTADVGDVRTITEVQAVLQRPAAGQTGAGTRLAAGDPPLTALLDAGLLTPVPGSRGLRFRIGDPTATAANSDGTGTAAGPAV